MKNAIKLIALSLVLVMSVMLLASCGAPNADPDKAVEALEKNDYFVTEDDRATPAILLGLGIKDVEVVVTGTAKIDDKHEHVTILYFEDAEAAKAAWENAQKYAEDKEKDEDESDWTIAQSGAMIYWGTSAAIKAAQ